MEKKENIIIGEELIKRIEAEVPQLQEEMNKFLDSLNGKYHCMTIVRVIGNTADMAHVGYDSGYMNGKLDLIKMTRKFLTDIDCELTGIETDEEQS